MSASSSVSSSMSWERDARFSPMPDRHIRNLRLLAFGSLFGRVGVELLTIYLTSFNPALNIWGDLLGLGATLFLCLVVVYVSYRVARFGSVLKLLLAATVLLAIPQGLDVAYGVYRAEVMPAFFQRGGPYVYLKNFAVITGVMFLLLGFYEALFAAFRTEQALAQDRQQLLREAAERERAERALRESESRFRRVLENSKDIIFELNLDTRAYEYMSPSSEQLFGFSAAEVAAMGTRGVSHRVHPEDRDRRYAHFKQAIDDSAPATPLMPIEYRIQVKSGEYRWASETWNVIRNETGRATAIVGTLRDVTETKSAEQAIRESEARHRALLHAIPDLMYVLFENGYVIDLRETPLATSADTAIEDKAIKRAEHLLPGDLGRQAMICYRRAVDTGRVQVLEFVRPTAGEVAYLEARFVMSGPDEVLVIVRDNTERIRLEREVLDVSTQEQQRIGQDLHDGLGQQLTGILCLSMGMVNSLTERGIKEAQDAAEIALLVKQAIAQTRSLARGLSPVILEQHGLPTALEDLARRTREIFKTACVLEARQYRTVHSKIVEEQLYRITQEAVNNAVKHAKSEQIIITLETQGRRTLLAIRDDGIGLPKDDGSRGRGMGLRNMEYRARMIGASLTIDPNPSGGTRVTCCVESDGAVGNATGNA